MDLYALDEEIDAFEASLSLPDNASRLPNLITLAWYLRQRDSRRSLELIKEAIVLLNKLPDDTHHYNYFHARIKLIKAEIHWLCGELELAKRDATIAFTQLEEQQNLIGLGDAYFLFSAMQMRDRLQSVFRESDYFVRWGGEEFLVVARSCNRKDAAAVAERIRYIVSHTPFTLSNDLEIFRTCSVGYASYPFLPQQPHLVTWAQVVNFADQGLYMVKKSGRNACIGITHTTHHQADDFYNRVMRHPQQAAQSQLIQIISHQTDELDEAIRAS